MLGFPPFSNCEQHDNVVIVCFSEKAHKCHLCTLAWLLRMYGHVFFFFLLFACGASKRGNLGFQSLLAQILA